MLSLTGCAMSDGTASEGSAGLIAVELLCDSVPFVKFSDTRRVRRDCLSGSGYSGHRVMICGRQPQIKDALV